MIEGTSKGNVYECLFSVKDILGYSRNEIIGQWFGRYLTTDDLDKFETIRRTQRKRSLPLLLLFDGKDILVENNQQTPVNICDVFDMYANNGESRLTFICQIRPTRERRSKSIKYSIIAQLIE